MQVGTKLILLTLGISALGIIAASSLGAIVYCFKTGNIEWGFGIIALFCVSIVGIYYLIFKVFLGMMKDGGQP